MWDPYLALPPAAELVVKSNSFADGGHLRLDQVAGMIGTGGGDRSPHLSWSGVPAETKGIAVTCFDPDAPTMSGFWHWAVWGIPAGVSELAEGAVTLDKCGDGFPKAAGMLRNDGGFAGFVGAAPPPGHGDHRYMFVVHALDFDLAPDPDASPALLGFQMFGHTLARGRITGLFGR